MQFAVILHECFKCHSCYSTSIKVGWMANTLSSKEMFPSGSPGIIDHWSYFHSLMHAHTYRKLTNCEPDNSALASLDTQLITNVHAVTQGCFCLFIFGISRKISSFVRSLHVLPQLIYKGSELSWPCMTHTQAHAHSFPPHDTMCYDWQIDWPTDCGCGATWQVEIGKWEAHFSLPSAEQRFKAFSSAEAIGRGGARGVQVVE